MSFATAAALLITLLVAVPVIAHLLRRGKTQEQEFPPAGLVPKVAVTSEQRSRIEDLLLLLLRAAMIIALAILGATPFVRCSDLSVDRQSGASVALAIVLDDSQSMQAVTSEGETRFELAKAGARQLLQSAREGDAVALISGGAPARLVRSAGADLSATREALDSMHVTDRSTDLGEAVALARSSLTDLPHVDKRVIVLSDLAARALPHGEPRPWTPLPELRVPVDNCGIATAERQNRGVLATIGCTSEQAAQGRKLQVFIAGEEGDEPLAEADLQSVSGLQKLDVKVDSLGLDVRVALSGEDAIASDDRGEVTKLTSELSVAVAADPARASTITGGPTVIVQALQALDPELDVRPLGELPQAAEDLKRYAALIIDDPPGLSPEERSALASWVEAGGAALALLGPASTNAQLASSLEPFARQGAQWEDKSPVGLSSDSLAWLGNEGKTLASLGGGGRTRLDAADLPGTQVVGKWEDDVPWLFQRKLGSGVLFTAGTPASVEHSDFALRPGFLALLDVVVQHGRQSRGPKRSTAGVAWTFPADVEVRGTGPGGAITTKPIMLQEQPAEQFVPERAGRYQLEIGDDQESRVVVLDPDELVLQPLDAEAVEQSASTAAADTMVNASPQWALLLLALFTGEMLFRIFGERWKRRFRKPSTTAAPSA